MSKQASIKEPRTAGRAAGHSNDEIYRLLRERIALLTYPPGTTLSEGKLAAEFGVSRTPIRQVLQRLEFDGLVEAKHGIGTLVSPIDFAYLRQVYALRLKLISLIAELSPTHANEGDLVILEELHGRAQEMRTAAPDPVQLSRLYTLFNEEVLRVIGNEPLREITDRLFYQTHRVWLQLLPTMDWEEEVGYVIDEFGEVLAGLREQDFEHVARVRHDHFVGCLMRMNRHMSGLDLGTELAMKT